MLKREASLVAGDRKVEVLREIARIVERDHEPALAIDAWRAVVDERADDREALLRLVEIADSQGETELLVEVGGMLVRVAEGAERSITWRRMGVACLESGRPDDARAYLERAVASEEPDLEAAARLEPIYTSRHEWPGLVQVLTLLGERHPDAEQRVERLRHAARIELDYRHDKAAAAVLYRRVVDDAPDDQQALLFLVEHCFETGRHAEALPLCRQLEPSFQDVDPDDFDAQMDASTFHFRFAEMLRSAGEVDEAVARYESTLKLNPTHLPALQVVGPLYTAQGEWKKAERVYRRLLQLTGGHGDTQQVAQTYTQLGLVERHLGNVEKAYKRFNKALEVEPNFVPALRGLAFILEDRRDWNTLLNVYNNIIYHATLPDDVVYAYMTKGRILDEELDRPDKAMQHYERSLAFDANQPVALLRLAELGLRAGDWHGVRELSHRGLELLGDGGGPVRAVLLLCRAIAHMALGKDAIAQTDLRAAVDAGAPVQGGPELLADLDGLRNTVREHLPR